LAPLPNVPGLDLTAERNNIKLPRYFALIPAAGASSRLGQPKLLLPLAGRPLILHTIAAWQLSRVTRIAVVVRADDRLLADAVRGLDIDVVRPDVPPPDMKSSIQAALRHIELQYQPTAIDAFLVAPADMPRLSPLIINRLIERHTSNTSSEILTPTLNSQRGHPVLFPWVLATAVHALAPDEGLDTVVHKHQPQSISCDDLASATEFPFADIDTPQQYRALEQDRL
jgi:molybdenum cofactor cytidylyltransferase